MRFLASLIACSLISGFASVSEAAECPVGFAAMQRLDLLPVFLPNGTQTKQFITYDPAGENNSGYFKRYEANGEHVFFDEIGPGFLCRQQMNVFSKYTPFPSEKVRIRYYFDDEAKPRIDMTFAEFFGKGDKYHAPFTPPLAYFDNVKWANGPGAYAILYYPFTFQKRLKITAYHPAGMKFYPATWFQYTYLKYPPGTPVETWKGKEVDSPAVRAQFEHRGEDPKGPIAGQTHRRSLSLARRDEDRPRPVRPRGDHGPSPPHGALVTRHVLPHPTAYHLGRTGDPLRRSAAEFVLRHWRRHHRRQ